MLTQANLRRKKAGTISTGQLGDHVRTNTIIVVNSMLHALDNYIRQSIRGWLRLPKDTPISYIHAGKQHGGLGIPSLSATIPMQRRVRMEKLLSTQCRVLRNVVNDSAFGKVVRDLSLPIRVHGSCVNTKEELVASWGDSLHNSVDGRGLRELVASPLSNRWLVFPERVFPRIFIRGIQLRCNLLRTRVRSARHGHGGQTILCRGNCGQPESLVHILQSCWITHDARCARHNRVARELAKRLRRLGYTVFEELRAPTSTSFIKPDLIAVRERRATVIDVSIVSDGRGVTVWNEKKQKYGADEFSLAIISALRAIGCDVDFLVHQPMIISYRGICFPQSAKAVIGLGLSKVTVGDLCLLAILVSLLIPIAGFTLWALAHQLNIHKYTESVACNVLVTSKIAARLAGLNVNVVSSLSTAS
ncbi:retrovirus-related Pol polyprotein from type-1 retrotransposable element R2, partial [Clonorchis sinensis]